MTGKIRDGGSPLAGPAAPDGQKRPALLRTGEIAAEDPPSRDRASLRRTPDASVIRGQVFSLAWPAITEMMLQTLTQIVDMIMVGRLGPAAIAAIGIANQPSFFTMAMFQALAVGTTALVARMVGAGDWAGASRVMKQSIALAVVMGVVVSVVLVVFAPWIIGFMGAAPDVAPQATAYFRVVVSGMLFTALSVIMIAALRGAGDTRTPMVARSIANVLNVVLNWVLIFGIWIFPRLGVVGAGVATITTRALTVAMIAFVISRGRSRIRPEGRLFSSWDAGIISRILNVGLPAAGEQLILRSGMLLFVRTVAAMGTLSMAAHQIAMNIESLSFMPGFGFAIASTTLVGQHLGAMRPQWSEKAGKETARVAAITMGLMGVFLFVLGPQIVHLYTDDPTVIQLGGQILRIMALVQPATAMSFTMGGGLRGAGDTRFVLLSSAVGIWGIRLLLAHILGVALGLGLPGAWMAMAADQCVRALLTTIRFHGGKWKSIRV